MFYTCYVHDDGFIAKCDTPISSMFCCWAWMGSTHTETRKRTRGVTPMRCLQLSYMYLCYHSYLYHMHTQYHVHHTHIHTCCHCMHAMHACMSTYTHTHRWYSPVPHKYPIPLQIKPCTDRSHTTCICHVHITSRS